MRVDYADEALRERVYALLDTGFPRISERIRIAEGLGARWHEESTAFVAMVGARPVAHAGVLPLPLVVGGERRLVAGIHAVCSHPDHRGRGHARAVLDEALAWADAHYETALLTTGIPDMYAPFGFRIAPEVVFEHRGPLPDPAPGGARKLRAEPSDLALLRALLAGREPVSHALACLDTGWLFLIDEVLACWGIERLYHAEELGVILALDCRGGTLRLLDVVGGRVPDLAALLAAVPVPFERVELHFTPDRVGGGPFHTRPTDPDDHLMVRGPWGVDAKVILPPLARC